MTYNQPYVLEDYNLLIYVEKNTNVLHLEFAIR